MGLRYEDAESVADILHQVRTRHFPELKNAAIKVLFDLKKRSKSHCIVLGRIMRGNDLIRHFSKAECKNVEGYDYIIILDKICWDAIGDEDRPLR